MCEKERGEKGVWVMYVMCVRRSEGKRGFGLCMLCVWQVLWGGLDVMGVN